MIFISFIFCFLKDEAPPPFINNFRLIKAKDKKLMFNTGMVVCVCFYNLYI